MKLEWKNQGKATILVIQGELDASNLPQLKDAFEDRIAKGGICYCVNLEGLRFVNSSAIGYLVALQRRLRQEGGDMVLSKPSKFLQTTIRTLGLDQVFAVFGSDEDAMRHCGGEETATIASDAPVDPSLLGSTEMKFRLADAGGPEAEAKILHIWKDGISFRYPDDPDRERIDPDELTFGRRLAVKFRQPFIDKNHVFDLEGEIAYALDQDDGSVKYHLQYTRISEADRKRIEDFVQTKDLVLPYLPRQE
jgi:anti-sigma B factor antagonist